MIDCPELIKEALLAADWIEQEDGKWDHDSVVGPLTWEMVAAHCIWFYGDRHNES